MNMPLIETALRIAATAHLTQKRKEADVPYITHPVAVALLLMRHGFADEVIAAALVHDVVEDSEYPPSQLRDMLGSEVSRIVEILTEDKSLSWEERKLRYIENIKNSDEAVKAVAIGDKIHNLQCLLFAYEEQGDQVWEHFNRGMEKKVWFEDAMLRVFKETWKHPLVEEYASLVSDLKKVIHKT